MQFAWDADKAAINLSKHGVSFEEAKTVFEDDQALVLFDEDHSVDEDRFVILGLSISLRLLVVCHCVRDEDQIRIISARKATTNEANTYVERRGNYA